ncbi:uncharacterized protein SPPG_03564 [Spizellomyces punctatus DAOM BR117]|uniref:Uncharacterized protein n=1 Tax=Spizellomyces punctatus (strain DAOM BR117) TaxID=645134 RepID=A0A0L0HKX8_SPIPD|nr:uncharacterized protein SPPG_03564 [Spizellomyces punctatus DAOM BR117]KND01772.1 hypothetical protein SPPG_03564 [Spizellomyces punctatus DAOM BR117]|eukprot:XP_016609811.1 hypothetical protein SPPG_03564 [Spizellomyces punctatus DAOM BR117]
MSNISEDDLPLTPTSPTGSSASGLPTSYYERYTRKYNLGERQRQLEIQEESRRIQQEMLHARNMDRGYHNGSSGVGSSVATSDHLETAVENLYRMVERKVSTDYTRGAAASSGNTTQSTLNPNNRKPQRASSWTSTAIHSEVSKLYNMGAATASPTNVPVVEVGRYPYSTADRSGGGGSTVSFWRSGRGLEDGEGVPKERGLAGDQGIPCELLLFIYGFLLPPLWWIGALRSEPTKWRTRCRWAAVLGTLIYLGVAAVLVWFFVFRKK